MRVFSLTKCVRSKVLLGGCFGLFFQKNKVFFNFGGVRVKSLKFFSFFRLVLFYIYLSLGSPVIVLLYLIG